MVRAILYVIVAVLVISALRSVIGIMAKAFAQFAGVRPPSSQPRRPTMTSGGELKRDPVCGTFISPATAIEKRVGGEVYYFCSEKCREKFRR
jgi:YHS domain-containing protein